MNLHSTASKLHCCCLGNWIHYSGHWYNDYPMTDTRPHSFIPFLFDAQHFSLFSLLLHFLNVISSQNTSDKHIDFTKSNVCFYRPPLSVPFSVFLFFVQFSSPHRLDDIFRVGKNCFCFAAVDQRLCWDDTKDKVLWKELRYSPLHRAFLG